MIVEREYQKDVMERLRQAVVAGHRRIILQASTGAGKTVMGSCLAKAAIEKHKSVLVLCHTREIVDQFSETLWEVGVPNGIILAGHERCPGQVQVASKDTLLSRVRRRHTDVLPHADLVITDECRFSTSEGWLWVLSQYKHAVIIGLDATPARKDGRALGGFYTKIISAVPMSSLIKMGYLVPFKVFAPHRPDLRGVKVKLGDYDEEQLGGRMNQPKLVGDIVRHWLDFGQNRPTICFASNIAHSMSLRDRFTEAGVRVAHIDGETPLDERQVVKKRLMDGDIQMVCNVGVYTNGWDCSLVSCIIMARPTRSLPLYLQMVGRGGRPSPGKDDCLVLDHGGCVYEHGFPDEDREWSLDSEWNAHTKAKKDPPEKRLLTCSKCNAIFQGRLDCPNCGFRVQKMPREAERKNGKLVEVEREDVLLLKQHDNMQRYWRKCLHIAAYRGGTAAIAANIFRAKYKKFPWEAGLPDLPSFGKWQTPASVVLEADREARLAAEAG